ncbi:MAG TPA: GNAT family protein [Longilinea sp.]|nr:GNAT family protein [Longilinea sp.]
MIYGKNLRLRAIEKQDLPHFVAWLNDREVSQNLLSNESPLSVAQEEKWYEKVLEQPLEAQPLAIEAHVGNEWFLLGDISLFDFNWRERSAEIGIFIGDKRFWNHGYGSEAMQVMTRHALFDLGLNRVYLHVFETNPRGIRAYEKAGFVLDGKLRQAHWQDGKFIDVLVMSIVRSDWHEEES